MDVQQDIFQPPDKMRGTFYYGMSLIDILSKFWKIALNTEAKMHYPCLNTSQLSL